MDRRKLEWYSSPMLTAARLLVLVLSLALAGSAMARVVASATDIAMVDCAGMTDGGMADCTGDASTETGATILCDLICSPPALATLPTGITGAGALPVARVREHDPGRILSGWTTGIDPSPPRTAILV
jgi:hypothetical protein